MIVYAVWNNKGGVGKSYLTFQLASEYAKNHRAKKVLVIDLCPQSNSSLTFLGGIVNQGDENLSDIQKAVPRKTIAGYIQHRIKSPYVSPKTGSEFPIQVCNYNEYIPENLFLVAGDEQLEALTSRVFGASTIGPEDAWRIVHLWIKNLIDDIADSWNTDDICVFIDCNPSFSIYTELALTAADRLLIPFSVDGASKRSIKTLLSLVYGQRRHEQDVQTEFHLNSLKYRMELPKIYMYIGNRLTQMNKTSASAFKTVVNEIGEELWKTWQGNPNIFLIHPSGTPISSAKKSFQKMFQFEINDANSASVVSGACGIPISVLPSGPKIILGNKIMVNISQLEKQIPNIKALTDQL